MRHIDAKSVVRTLIDNGQLVSQIARLVTIVLKIPIINITCFYKKENIVLEVTNQVQELSDPEVLNNSTDEDVTMAVNNEVAEHDHSLRPDLETQADDDEEHKDQAKEIEESETLPSCNEQKPQCQICEENEAVVAFKPCGHTVVCIGDFSLLLLLLFIKCRK